MSLFNFKKEVVGKYTQTMPKNVTLVPIDADYFQVGMYVDYEVYLKVDDVYVLFCKNVRLDEVLLTKMKSRLSRTNYAVYITQAKYEEIRRTSDFFKKVSPEEEREYQKELARAALKKQQEREVKEFVTVSEKSKQIFMDLKQGSSLSLKKCKDIVESVSNQIANSDSSILIQCINNIRDQDSYLYTHGSNVATLNGLIGKWMELSEDAIEKLIHIGLYHDLGKIYISDYILDKPGSLTPEEYETIKKHPIYSEQILLKSGITDPQILAAVRGHHERNNGTGYPDGLRKKDISLFARITAVSDVYDAMVAEQPYKKARSPFEVLAEFSVSRYSDLDNQIVTLFLNNIPKLFIGKQALLSDGRIARIQYLNPNDFRYPIVSVENGMLKTDESVRCVSVDSFSMEEMHQISV